MIYSALLFLQKWLELTYKLFFDRWEFIALCRYNASMWLASEIIRRIATVDRYLLYVHRSQYLFASVLIIRYCMSNHKKFVCATKYTQYYFYLYCTAQVLQAIVQCTVDTRWCSSVVLVYNYGGRRYLIHAFALSSISA